MKAITTTYRPPTDSRGARITASDLDGNQVSIPYQHGLMDKGHGTAVLALCRKMGWSGTLQGGGLKNGMVWCFLDRQAQVTAKERTR